MCSPTGWSQTLDVTSVPGCGMYGFVFQGFTLAIHQVRLHDVKTIALVPRSHLVSLPLIALTCGSIEILVNQTRRGLNNSNRKWRLLHALKRGGAKARMWVISRVIRNCSASLVPGSSVKSIRRS